MGRRTIALVFAVSLLCIASGAGAASPAPRLIDRHTEGTDTIAALGNIRHVANVAYTGGSDLEFATKIVDGVERDYAFAGVLNRPVEIIDITDPEAPFRAARIPCSLYQNDVQVSGDLLIMAADNRGSCTMPNGAVRQFIGFAVADISDPRSPRVLGTAEIGQGAHNLTVHPTEPLVYVSNSDLPGLPAQVHIWDISDPAAPTKVQDWAYGQPLSPPHDITFNAAGTRAYAASITHIDIFDTTDARSPALITTFSDPMINIAHQADPTPDGKYMIVSDELAGAATGPVCPGGGLHVYDLTVEVAPAKVGVFWSDTVSRSGTCTSHVFRINPDGHTMAIAWYNDGVHVIDFAHVLKAGIAGTGTTSGVGTKTIAALKMDGADTWSAKMWQERHPGYVFANDMGRGFDVFHVPELT